MPYTSAVGVAGSTIEAHDLCELTKEYAREQRESWGSWTTGGGGPGVVCVSSLRSRPPHQQPGQFKAYRRSGEEDGEDHYAVPPASPPPLLQEADLESLGGRY